MILHQVPRRPLPDLAVHALPMVRTVAVGGGVAVFRDGMLCCLCGGAVVGGEG